MNKNIIKHALINAGITATYIIIVVAFLSNGETIFGNDDEKEFLIPIIMLLVFVISATITGGAVLGRPIIWYLDGKKKDAFKLLATTIGILAIIAVILIAIALAR